MTLSRHSVDCAIQHVGTENQYFLYPIGARPSRCLALLCPIQEDFLSQVKRPPSVARSYALPAEEEILVEPPRFFRVPTAIGVVVKSLDHGGFPLPWPS